MRHSPSSKPAVPLNPMWRRPWIDVEAEIGARVDAHRLDVAERARRDRLKLLASRALAIAYVALALAGTVGYHLRAVSWVLAGCALSAALVAACLRAAAALPREPRGVLLDGRHRRRPGGEA